MLQLLADFALCHAPHTHASNAPTALSGGLLNFAIYALVLVVVTMLAGALPLAVSAKIRRPEVLLSFSAGIMLGAAFTQMIPEAIELSDGNFLPLSFVLVGALTMYLVERFVALHLCEEPEEGCEVHQDVHGHEALGIVALVGLSIHTLFDGIALGSSFVAGIGFVVFLAIIAHKIPTALALGTILLHAGDSRQKLILKLLVFALTVPLGAALYFLADHHLDFEDMTAWVLAFSAGTFLYLALADLLPHVHKKSKLRGPTIVALCIGVFAMYALRLLGGHGH